MRYVLKKSRIREEEKFNFQIEFILCTNRCLLCLSVRYVHVKLLFRRNGPHMMNILKSGVVDSHLDGVGTSYKAPLSGKLSVQRSAVFALLAEVKKMTNISIYCNSRMSVCRKEILFPPAFQEEAISQSFMKYVKKLEVS